MKLMEQKYKDKMKIHIDYAESLATLSKCTERHVAAVITNRSMNQVLSIGINGGPKGLDDCLCITPGKYGCIHAEINALIKCTSDEPGKRMFVTLAPCKQCAAAIINAPGKFASVVYKEPWKRKEGVELLEKAGIRVYSLDDIMSMD